MRVPRHVVEARQSRLAELLQTHGYIPINEICRLTKVSEATVRRDLEALSRSRRITRTHGGALADFNVRFPSFLERQGENTDGKRAIARQAVGMIQQGMTCFFDSGTTIHAIASLLREQPVRPLTAVTNNLHVALVLSDIDGVRVHMIAGQLLPRQAVLLGDVACKSLNAWDFDISFIGAEGVTREGIWNTTVDIVRFQTVISKRSRLLAVCLDRNKIDRTAQEFLFPLPKGGRLLTDATAADLERAGVSASGAS